MKVCTQCASETNKPVRVNKEIVCQECASKLKSPKNIPKDKDSKQTIRREKEWLVKPKDTGHWGTGIL